MSPTKANSTAPIEIASADPEVMTLQAIIKGAHHFNSRQLTMRHFKVLMAVKLCLITMKREPRALDIATFSRLKLEDIREVLCDLVERQYLHEVMPPFGDLVMTYKLGSRGGTVLRHMMSSEKAKPRKDGGKAQEEVELG